MQYRRQHWLKQHSAVQPVLSNSFRGVSTTHTHTHKLQHIHIHSLWCQMMNWIYSCLFSRQRRCQPRVDYVDYCRLLFLPLTCWKGKGRYGCRRSMTDSNFRVSAVQRLSSDPNSKSQTETMQHVLTGEMLLALARQMLLHFSYEVYAAGMTALRLCPAL